MSFISGTLQQIRYRYDRLFTISSQTNGLCERVFKTLADMLAKIVKNNQRDWDTHMSRVITKPT
jgi:hypothetical protein